MFHVTSVLLACLDQLTGRARRDADHHQAATHGWQVEQVTPGTYRCRDPRFDQFKAKARS